MNLKGEHLLLFFSLCVEGWLLIVAHWSEITPVSDFNVKPQTCSSITKDKIIVGVSLTDVQQVEPTTDVYRLGEQDMKQVARL